LNALYPQGAWDLDDRINVVLFAGMGGGCDGLEDAGFPVHLAINHDPLAIAVHEKRHPHTKHLRCDVFEVDPRQAVGGKRIGILHASPDCTHFSVAKGSKPVTKRRRSLAWVICRWAGQVRPELVTFENVREIKSWGPLVARRDPATGRVLRLDGTVAPKGERTPVEQQWLVPDKRHKGRIWRAFKKHLHGLGYSFEHMDLCCADFGVPTIRTRLFGIMRADGGAIFWPARTHAPRDKYKALKLKAWVGFHTCIDWSLPLKSIFNRPKDLVVATMRRIARGVMRYVVTAAKPFIAPVTHAGDLRVHSMEDPSVTWTTANRGELALVVPVVTEVAAHLQKFRPGASGGDLEEPMPVYSANSFNKRPGCAPPLGVAAVMLERQFGNSAGADVEEPAPTMMAGGGGKTALVAASMVGLAHGDGAGGINREYDLNDPGRTFHAGGGNAALVAAFMAQHTGGSHPGQPAKPIIDPLSTFTSTPQQAVVTATLGSLRGTNVDGRDLQQPAPAQSAGGFHEMLILPFLQAYYQCGSVGGRVDDPLRALTERARHGLVTVVIDGVTLVITDICMRMIDPLEGAKAHGFDPKSLLIEIEITDKRGRTVRRKLTKTEMGHLVGNSVPPLMVRLLVEHNVHRALGPMRRADVLTAAE
jgi:DNA (cytosine-5)-methyltransferase 1